MTNIIVKQTMVKETLGFSLTPVLYKGKPIFFPKEIGDILGYKDIADTIKKLVGSGEFEDGFECMLIRGKELAELKMLVHSVVSKEATEKPDDTSLQNDGNPYPVVLLPKTINQFRMLTSEGIYALVLKSTKSIGREFRKWVRREVLPSILETGHYTIEQEIDAKKLMSELKHASMMAEFFELKGNQAKLAAAKYIRIEYGKDLLSIFNIELPTERQTFYMTPTTVGKHLGGIRANKVNLMLAALGYQHREVLPKGDKRWVLTDKGKADNLGRYYDTNKHRSDGTPIQQIKWSEDIIKILQDHIDNGFFDD